MGAAAWFLYSWRQDRVLATVAGKVLPSSVTNLTFGGAGVLILVAIGAALLAAALNRVLGHTDEASRMPCSPSSRDQRLADPGSRSSRGRMSDALRQREADSAATCLNVPCPRPQAPGTP